MREQKVLREKLKLLRESWKGPVPFAKRKTHTAKQNELAGRSEKVCVRSEGTRTDESNS